MPAHPELTTRPAGKQSNSGALLCPPHGRREPARTTVKSRRAGAAQEVNGSDAKAESGCVPRLLVQDRAYVPP